MEKYYEAMEVEKSQAEKAKEDGLEKIRTSDATAKGNTGKKKKSLKKKKAKLGVEKKYEPTKLEDNVSQVLQRFERGCECQDDKCFKNLNSESVFRHRLNIAELSKAEHDMYLMGVTMASLADTNQMVKSAEKRRIRAQYIYQGRRVCLDAFLYLENCTQYQIKRIRKHLLTHGVAPRAHGNHGKVPHNAFSLEIYQTATEFLKKFISKQKKKMTVKVSKRTPLHLPPEITRKAVHGLYKEYAKVALPTNKAMGYSTFRRFIKVQFPQIKFAKIDAAGKAGAAKNDKGDGQQAGQAGESAGEKKPGGADANSSAYFVAPTSRNQEDRNYPGSDGVSKSGSSVILPL